ncbi:hypothetical protein B566_EDAN005259 [Ephemera danica]|nr:hypothetical protein B566_EDAN005259 [Ephemera danica]
MTKSSMYVLPTLLVLVCVFHSSPAENFKVTQQVYFDVKIGDKDAGRLVIGLFGEVVPKTVKNFFTIATEGINGKTYAGTRFHRVIKRFMIQGGKNTNGCQFFITTVATPWLDGHHTVFGKVIQGQSIVHEIEMLMTDTEDHPQKPVVVVASGELPTNSPFVVSDQPYE